MLALFCLFASHPSFSAAQTKETFYVYPNTYEIIMAEDDTRTSEVKLIPNLNSGGSEYNGNEDVPDEVVYNGETFRVVEFGYFQRSKNDLSQLRFGKNMRNIDIFNYGFGLKKGFEVNAENKSYKTIDNLLYSHDGKTLLMCSLNFTPSSKDRTIELPDSVETIATKAFYGCSQIKGLKLPKALKEIKMYAFSNFKNSLSNFVLPEGLKRIENNAFEWTKISKLTLPKTLEYMGDFGILYQLDSILCLAPSPPSTYSVDDERIAWLRPVNYQHYENSVLIVPNGSKELYKQHPDWGRFRYIMEIDGEKCATPTIIYEKGRLLFSCATEGAHFFSKITCDDCDEYTDCSINLSATYNISVYAIAKGFNDSDVLTATLCWLDAEPILGINPDSAVEMHARPLLMQAREGVLSITGLKTGETAQVYSISGQQLASAKAGGNTLAIPLAIPSGQTLIVKIADKAVKVIMK
jgi:hypothetical protein